MTPTPGHVGLSTTGNVAVLGEESRVAGYALAGAVTLVADDPTSVRTAWQALGPEVAVVVLTPAATDVLRELAATSTWPLVAVMPG